MSASFIGTLPGPKTGMTFSTLQVVERLRNRCELRELDLGQHYKRPGVAWRIKKMLFSILAVATVLLWKRRKQEAIYIAINSTSGLIYNVFQVLAARLRGFRLFLHHHTYNYIECPDWRMRLLLWASGPEARHVMACQQMVDDFCKAYDCSPCAIVAPPALVPASSDESRRIPEQDEPFVLGHLSNLTSAKGLNEVLDTFEQLVAVSERVRLVLAGPCHAADDRDRIEAAIAKHHDRVRWLGPVYADDKATFFDQIDCFLFPTKTESWGIVLNEALAEGIPVISVGIACIPCLIENGGAWARSNTTFVREASELIKGWLEFPERFTEVQRVARDRGRAIADEIDAKMEALAEQIASGETCDAK